MSGQGNTILVASAAPSDTLLAADAQASAAAEAEVVGLATFDAAARLARLRRL